MRDSNIHLLAGIGVLDDDTTLLSRRNNGGTSLGSSLLVLGESEIVAVEVLVDDSSHALLAVIADSLGAVVPDGVLGLDDELEDILGLTLLDGKLETREETVATSQGLARVSKVGLGDGVVLGHELPLDHVTDLGDHIGRLKVETVETGSDRVCYSCQMGCARDFVAGCGSGCGESTGGKESASDDVGEGEHFDCWNEEFEEVD